MNCHKCPHHEAILRGDYDSTPWNELPCAHCKLSEDTFYSIPFDEEHPPNSDAPWSFKDVNSSGLPKINTSPLIPADVLSEFVTGLLNLPPELRDVVSLRFQGMPYKEIAERQGTSIQCAEMRHKRAMRDWPVLKSLFPRKTAKRRRRLSLK